MTAPQMMAACPRYDASRPGCKNCSHSAAHDKKEHCDDTFYDYCPVCTPIPAAEQPPRKTPRERIEEEADAAKPSPCGTALTVSRWYTGCVGPCKMLAAADAREDALRVENADLQGASMKGCPMAEDGTCRDFTAEVEDLRAQLAAANEERERLTLLNGELSGNYSAVYAQVQELERALNAALDSDNDWVREKQRDRLDRMVQPCIPIMFQALIVANQTADAIDLGGKVLGAIDAHLAAKKEGR